MAISNGFNLTQILQKLTGRMGWRQPASGEPVIDEDNSESASGRYFQDFHPLLTVQNIKDTIEGGADMDDEAVNAFLTRLQQSAILRTINGVFNRSQLIESTLIFDRKLRNDIPIRFSGKFCGYRFWVAPGEFAAQLSRVSFIFSAPVTFTLYLYQDGIAAPLKTKSVTITRGYSEQYVELDDWIMNYISDVAAGGVYYLGYYQDEITEQDGAFAIDEFVSLWRKSYAFGYTAFEQTANWNGGVYPDFTRISVPYTLCTYGMNVEVQTYYDFTNKIVKNASLFDEAVGLTLAIEVLGYLAYSTRSNEKQRITQEMSNRVYNEIMNSGDADQLNPYVAGYKQQLTQEIARLNRNFFTDPRRGEVKTSRPPVYVVSKSLP